MEGTPKLPETTRSAEYVADEAVVEKLAGVGPKVCFCCRACAMSALTILARAGVEMRLIDGRIAESEGGLADA